MGPRAACALASVAAVLVAGPTATATPPQQGILVPGQSLGGIRIGLTRAQVKQAWGTAFGRCRDCPRETWYFNYERFQPQGAGVIFRRGRVVHVFTVWQPAGWHTSKGLMLGAADYEVTRTYGALGKRACVGYDALVMPGRRAHTIFYVDHGEVWGFGLTRPDSFPCL